MDKKKLTEKAIEREKKKVKRKARKALRRAVFFTCGGLTLFCGGYFVGVHRNAIWAYLKGIELPKSNKCPFHR